MPGRLILKLASYILVTFIKSYFNSIDTTSQTAQCYPSNK